MARPERRGEGASAFIMMVMTSGTRTEEVARQLFDLATQVNLAVHPERRTGELKELEYLTLAILSERGTMIVGDIQRLLGVMPAQMSRIIRSLEHRDRPLLACGINPQDKRKVDVRITPMGHKALADYRAGRVHRIAERLRELHLEEREDLLRSLDKLLELLEESQAVPSI